MLIFVVSVPSCSLEEVSDFTEEPKDILQDTVYTNYYLTGVIKERHYSVDQILDMIDSYAENMEISTSILSLFLDEVNVAAITYMTTGVDGKPVEASGVIAFPSNKKEYSHLLSIQHETTDMEDAPSNQMLYIEMAPVEQNHIVIMPDYLGYGVSQTIDRQHPYLHNENTGKVCADMIEAAREYLRGKGIKENNNKLELIGYSQGASATISTVLELEKRGEGNRIRAVHVGGGVYDLKGTVDYIISIANESIYKHTESIPYIIRGMEYGEQISLNDTNLYAKRVVDNDLISMFSTTSLYDWQSKLGTDVTQVLHPDFFAAPSYNNNQDVIQLMDILKENTLINYEPTTSVVLYHSPNDDFVPYFNSERAHAKWANSTLIDMTKSSHSDAGVEFIVRYMDLWDLLGDNLFWMENPKPVIIP